MTRKPESTSHERRKHNSDPRLGQCHRTWQWCPWISALIADVPKLTCCGILMSVAVGITMEASKMPRSGSANGTIWSTVGTLIA